MTKMNSHRRSLSAALDMVEAAIDSLENQARQAKLFQEQQQKQQEIAQRLTASPAVPLVSKILSSKPHSSQESDEENIEARVNHIQDKITANHTNSKKAESIQQSSVNKINGNLSKKSTSILKTRSHPPSVLLHHRSSTPRKKSHKRSSSGSSKHRKSSHNSRKRERNNNVPLPNDVTSESVQHKPLHDNRRSSSSSSRASRYSHPTLSSKLREQLTEKPKKKDNDVLPFVASGTQGKSYHVGVIIQKELGKLKSQPLEIWAAAKQSAARKEVTSSSILHRELSKN